MLELEKSAFYRLKGVTFLPICMLANMLGLRCCELLAVNSLGITFLCFPIPSAVFAHIAVLNIKSLVAADMQAILPEFVGVIVANQVCRYFNEGM